MNICLCSGLTPDAWASSLSGRTHWKAPSEGLQKASKALLGRVSVPLKICSREGLCKIIAPSYVNRARRGRYNRYLGRYLIVPDMMSITIAKTTLFIPSYVSIIISCAYTVLNPIRVGFDIASISRHTRDIIDLMLSNTGDAFQVWTNSTTVSIGRCLEGWTGCNPRKLHMVL